MRRVKLERETVIVFNEQDELASIWTCAPMIEKKLMKMGFHGDARGGREGKYFEIPKKLVNIRKHRKEGRHLSIEEVQKRRASLQRLKASPKSIV